MEIVGKFEDERIKVVNHSQNMGAGWARRTGIAAATGDYVITVDGDDWLAPDFIEALAKNAEETDADIVSGGITYVWSDTYEEVKRFLPHISEGMDKFRDYGNKKIVFLNNKLVRRTMYDTVPYSTRRYCEDTPVILPLLYLANKVSYVDVQGYYYLQHDKSLCRRVNAFEEALFKALCSQEMQAFFGDKGEEYQGLISVPEYIGWLRTIKATMTPQLAQVYRSELGEIMPHLLNLVEI
jgi:glycosyltransferase involved in cell wall biosynthesis